MFVLIEILLFHLSAAYVRERNKKKNSYTILEIQNFLFMIRRIKVSDVADWFHCRSQT